MSSSRCKRPRPPPTHPQRNAPTQKNAPGRCNHPPPSHIFGVNVPGGQSWYVVVRERNRAGSDACNPYLRVCCCCDMIDTGRVFFGCVLRASGRGLFLSPCRHFFVVGFLSPLGDAGTRELFPRNARYHHFCKRPGGTPRGHIFIVRKIYCCSAPSRRLLELFRYDDITMQTGPPF